ncbi:ABC transporter substrate-binding protein [Rhodobacter veldkampii DSM 11550]|uniref:ABC transporter substrate-binding protein n=1 Tax=Phaeovulum veldkampii DSM 11550 TaxID=1185920 RepID=A0A2T4JK79_9RHOB|nr:extracellular solute-binding protein [Phaeovulum veldkampii]MBK5946066.1 ABC transporter substrate-binding protein [Phaeovulum veldkampii DSM 11550]NCU19955.1 ABC transporter substrate-binding protein [Candidatus Falkowbacteria bacterium]PTE18167.1 ABC transporter substrate-binding protein [Phaeovulum veldkampii DSM 11550]TDQ63534.1 microcin C transport system substrate-binding protein [Phaeovulum veldkampii DSM 11550]
MMIGQRAIRAVAAIGLATALWAGAPVQAQNTIVSHGISTFGDLKYAADFPHLDYVNPEAPKGGEISVWTAGGFDSFNPYTLKGRAAALASVVHESLLTSTADEIGAAYGLLAESLEYPESRDWVIFTLRPEATFSDGSPVTAEDVLFSYETMRDKGLISFRAVLTQQVAGAEVLDARRIKFTFTPDYPRRDVIQSVGGLPVFSKADYIAKGRDLENSSDTPFLGSGPYVFDTADMGRRVVWRRNPDYWGADLPINRGRSNFDRIRVEYFGDYEAAFEGFKAGAYTFRTEASSLIWATRYNFPALDKGWVVKRTLPNGQIGTGQAFSINLRRDRFQDPRVREALGLMFNFEWANETLFYGLYTRTNSFWDNSELAATGTPGPDELALLEPLADQLPPGVLTDPAVVAPTSGPRQLDRGNLRKAAALLDAAGWPVADDGMRRNPQGQTLRVEILNDSQTFDRVINPYVENLRALGVDAVHTRVDDAQFTNRERSHDFDMITDQLGQDYIPGSGLQQYFGSGSVGDVFNSMGLAHPAVDALIAQVEAAHTRDEMTTAVRALDRVLRALRFWVPQWHKAEHTVAYYDMYEHPEALPPYALGELDFWWYNAEKAEKLKAAGAF